MELVRMVILSWKKSRSAFIFTQSKTKTAAVSYAFNDVWPFEIKIMKNILDAKFTSYIVVGGFYEISTNSYIVNTNSKQFQAILTNVVFR